MTTDKLTPARPSEAEAGGASPFTTPKGMYRLVAIAESITWTLLIIGMLLKYVAGLGTLPVLIAGSIHGFVFITYALTAGLVGVNQRWSVPRIRRPSRPPSSRTRRSRSTGGSCAAGCSRAPGTVRRAMIRATASGRDGCSGGS